MAKMTKTAGRKRLAEIQLKAFRLMGAGYITINDYAAILKIVNKRTKELK